MHNVLKITLVALALLAALMMAVAGCRQALQHRAVYSGGLTFIGAADGLFGSRYHRLFLWKAPGYTDGLPAFTVHIEGTAYALSDLTPELFAELGGTLNEGGLYDSTGTVLQYRFADGKLTWFSLDSGAAAPTTPGGNVRSGQFKISGNGSGETALPVSRAQLVETLGVPEQTRLVFVQ